MARRRPFVVLLIVAGCLALLGVGLREMRVRGGRSRAPRAVSSPGGRVIRAAADSTIGRSGYVGPARCGSCHKKNYDAWTHDWHAHALARARPGAVAGEFTNVHFKGSSSEAWMSRTDSLYIVRTRDREERLGDYPVRWVIGGKRMQDPVTVFDDGRWQVLPVYYHVTGKEWVDYNEFKQGRVGPDHPFYWTNFRRMANRECLDCHATGVDVRYDPGARSLSTRFTNAGVGCESCHGPGAKHSSTEDPDDIIQPRHVGAELGLAICAQCHGPREPYFPILDTTHGFRPGDRYEDHYRVVMVTDGSTISPDFFADGRPKSSSFEYQALIQSLCYRKGGATCLSCHTAPHQEHGADELPLAPDGGATSAGDATCRRCHAREFEEGTRHTHHRSAAARSCMSCHMPKVVMGVLDPFADHSFDVPAPENTTRHGVPNACNVCHTDKTAAEMAQALHSMWPEAGRRQARRLRLADAFDTATAAQSEPFLKDVIRDSSETSSIRGAASTLLALRYPADAAASIIPLLGARDGGVRLAAATALGYAPEAVVRNAVTHLPSLLSDPVTEVRVQAAEILAFLDAPGGEEALRKVAGDSSTAGLVQPHFQLGILAAQHGQFPAAEAEMRQAIRLQFYDTYAMIALADIYAAQHEWGEAKESLEDALRFEPWNEAARQRLASIPKGQAASPGRR